jgi:hypothetical protein
VEPGDRRGSVRSSRWSAHPQLQGSGSGHDDDDLSLGHREGEGEGEGGGGGEGPQAVRSSSSLVRYRPLARTYLGAGVRRGDDAEGGVLDDSRGDVRNGAMNGGRNGAGRSGY